MSRTSFLAIGLAAGLSAGAGAQERSLVPGVTVQDFSAGSANIIAVRVEPGAAELRIVSPESGAHRKLSPTEQLCDQLATSLFSARQTEERRSRDSSSEQQATQFLESCKSRLPVQREIPLAEGLFLTDFAKQFEPIALLSGGYMQSFSPPTALGYIKVGGVEISRSHRSWLLPGVLCTGGENWSIRPFTTAEDTDGFEDCLQTGPFLVRNGNDRYATLDEVTDGERKLALSEQEQAFVCVMTDGEALLGYSTAISAMELSAFAADIGCVDALRLSGHTTPGIWLEGELRGNSELPLASAIAVFTPR